MFFKNKKIKIKKLYPNLKINKDFIIQGVKPLQYAKKKI